MLIEGYELILNLIQRKYNIYWDGRWGLKILKDKTFHPYNFIEIIFDDF